MVKPLSHTAVILVHETIDISHFNNLLTLGGCVGKRLMMGILPRNLAYK